jgi:hypothetical protein
MKALRFLVVEDDALIGRPFADMLAGWVMIICARPFETIPPHPWDRAAMTTRSAETFSTNQPQSRI